MATDNNTRPQGAHETVNGLEKWLDDVYRKVPFQLPSAAKEWIARNAYWIAAISGVLGLLGAFGLWQAANTVDQLSRFSNELSAAYGVTSPGTTGLGFFWWILVAVVVVQAILALLAVAPLKDRRKTGWNLMFYSALINVVVGVVYLFVSGYGASNFVGSLIGSAIGFYFLFQIRPYFLGTKKPVIS